VDSILLLTETYHATFWYLQIKHRGLWLSIACQTVILGAFSVPDIDALQLAVSSRSTSLFTYFITSVFLARMCVVIGTHQCTIHSAMWAEDMVNWTKPEWSAYINYPNRTELSHRCIQTEQNPNPQKTLVRFPSLLGWQMTIPPTDWCATNTPWTH